MDSQSGRASIGFYLISTLPHHLLVNRSVRSGL